MAVLRIDPMKLSELQEYIPAAQAHLRQALPRNRVDGSPFGVDRSTIRSFRGFGTLFPGGPLRRYNVWAERWVGGVKSMRPFGSRGAFEQWYSTTLDSLDTHFEGRLATHHRHKLADLFIKWCARYEAVDLLVREELVRYGYCPLDSKSLRVLGALAPGTVLNRNPSMGDVLSEVAYQYAQEVVAEAAAHIPCTPLEFDVIAWNLLG